MKLYHLSLLLFILSSCSTSAQPPSVPQFGSRVDRGLVENDDIDEASGLAASMREKGLLWTHNDSGDSTRIFALGTDGSDRGRWLIEGVAARDWEDMASGPGPIDSLPYLYVGDIGDNSAVYDEKRIYRFVEPVVDARGEGGRVTEVETITYRYDDGRRDAEGLFVDPVTRDIFVVSKREASVMLYRLAWPQSTDTTMTAEHVATIDELTQVTAATISPDGSEILLKSYTTVLYWHRGEETVVEAFDEEPITVPYSLELQGEAITFDSEGQGYYTISEEPQGIPTRLSYYPRMISSADEAEETEAGESEGADRSKRIDLKGRE